MSEVSVSAPTQIPNSQVLPRVQELQLPQVPGPAELAGVAGLVWVVGLA